MRSRFFLLFVFFVSPLFGQQLRNDLDELKKINVTEKLGSHIPLEVEVVSEHGTKMLLKEYFNNDVPVLLVLSYYECPMLCGQVMSAVSASVQKLDWESQDRYQIATISIDPSETPDIALRKKKFYLAEITDPEIKNNWSFFTASQTVIDTIANAVGFEYYYVKERDEYAHPAAVFVLSPDGKISRYLYGLNFEAKDLKFALLEASEGKVGSTLEKLLLYCYHYDSASNTYTPFAKNIMRLGGLVTLVILSTFLSIYWLREHKQRKILA